MIDVKEDSLFLFIDGDSIGAMCGRAVMANDVEKLRSVSSRIDAAQEFIQNWCAQVGGIKISGGGDEASMQVPKSAKDQIEDLRSGIEKSFGYTISVGVGRSLSEAGTALLVAKLRGKDRIVYFNKHIKNDIKKAKRRVREGRASQEEYKLSEAYLEKSEDMGKICGLHKKEMHKKHAHELHKAATGHEKGIHTGFYQGSSSMGDKIRQAAADKEHYGGGKVRILDAKQEAKKVLGEMKQMPKPDLGKSEEDGSEEGKHADHVSTDDSSSCPYCADNEDNRTDDCQFCADLDAEENADGTAGMHNCQACKEYDAADQNTGAIDNCPYCQEDQNPSHNPDEDGCPYCESETVGQANAGTPAEQGAEDHHQCNCPDCPKNDQTALGVEDAAAERPDDCEQCQQMYGDAIEEQPNQTGQSDPNMQGHETAEEVLDLLDQEPGTGDKTPAQEAKQIDNTELPQGDQMRENTSVKENFGQAQKNDISDSEKSFAQDHPEHAGDSEDEPDMASVLQSGLEDHASEQQKQQVLNMVAQTLAGFKSNKASLEATKEQNQPLYNSCIQMLKSMIELCKLLGLKPPMPSEPEQASEVAAPVTQPPSSAEGSASPKAQGQE